MRSGPIITTIVCGTALVIMPQIHAAVFSANLLACAGAIAASDRPPDDALVLAQVAAPGWMASASTALGAAMIIAVALAGLGRPRNATLPPRE